MPAPIDKTGRARHWAPVGQRVALAVVGGYGLSAAAAALLALALSQVLPRSEAVMAMAMGVFLIYLFVLLWAFAEQCLRRLWIVLGGGAAAAQGVVIWLERT